MNETLEERIRRYWNAQPCNIKHGTAEPGTPEFFQQVSERRYKVEPHIAEFAGFHLWQGKRVLEVGCGIASDGEEFAKHGAEYVGIDYSDQSIEVARNRFNVLGLEGEFYNIDASNSEETSSLGQFDLVYSYGVIHHFPAIKLLNYFIQAWNISHESNDLIIVIILLIRRLCNNFNFSIYACIILSK